MQTNPTPRALHQRKASGHSNRQANDQAGNGGNGDGHGDTTGQTWNANLLARFNDGPSMNGGDVPGTLVGGFAPRLYLRPIQF
jgi:hypothetical protein